MPLAAPPGPLWTADAKEPHPSRRRVQRSARRQCEGGNRVPSEASPPERAPSRGKTGPSIRYRADRGTQHARRRACCPRVEGHGGRLQERPAARHGYDTRLGLYRPTAPRSERRLPRLKTPTWIAIWVDDMPPSLEPGNLYISVKHRLTEHLCACGCGAEVSLPLGRNEWRIEYDGESVTVRPSIGNWRLPCRSHYIIDGGHTRWCPAWTEKEVRMGQAADRKAKTADIARRRRQTRWWSRVRNWFRRCSGD